MKLIEKCDLFLQNIHGQKDRRNFMNQYMKPFHEDDKKAHNKIKIIPKSDAKMENSDLFLLVRPPKKFNIFSNKNSRNILNRYLRYNLL